MNKIETIISEYRKNHCNENLTDVQIHERLFGENSCFTIHHDYHGLYEDDWDVFTYFSNETGENFKDKWGTMYACPPYSYFQTKYTFAEAIKLGLVNIDKYNENWKYTNNDYEFDGDYMSIKFFNEHWEINPLVEIYRGRKNKGGKGYILKTVTDTYYGTTYCIFYDIDKKEFYKINIRYFRIVDEFLNKLEGKINDYIKEERKVTDRIRTFDFSKCIDIAKSIIAEDYDEFMDDLNKKSVEWANMEEEKKYEPNENFMNWLRNHFEGKTDEELREIGIRINKKNNKY